MKLYATIGIHVRGEQVLRAPRFVDKLRRAFGGRPDLRTGRVRASIEATAIVEAVRDAMRRLDITNAIALVVDDTVLFQDPHARPDDLGDLFLAFHDNAAVFGGGFDELRLSFEHREADLHVVAEVQARTEHPGEDAAVRVVVSGRVEALTPRPGEDADAFRRRAAPVAADRAALEMYELQFKTFVARLRDALAAAMPAARVVIEVAEPRIVRPGREPAAPPSPHARSYDPYDAYYPNTLGVVANAFLWSALFSTAMPPHVTIVDQDNRVEGQAGDPGIEDSDATWWSDSDSASATDGDWDFDLFGD